MLCVDSGFVGGTGKNVLAGCGFGGFV